MVNKELHYRKDLNYYDVPVMNSMKEIMERAVKEAGDNIAFEYKDSKTNDIVKITYKEFDSDTNYLGTALSTMKVEDKHIAVIGENSYEWITVYLTVLKGSGVLVPIDKELTCEEIINVLKSSDSEVLFFSSKYEKFVDEIKKSVPKIKYFIGFNPFKAIINKWIINIINILKYIAIIKSKTLAIAVIPFCEIVLAKRAITA